MSGPTGATESVARLRSTVDLVADGLASVENLRDVGGLPTRSGAWVRAGQLYRSTALDRLADAELATFALLGLHTVYDMRTESERLVRPDRLPASVDYVGIDVLSDLSEATPGQMMETMLSPAAAREAFGEGRGVAMFVEKYRQFVCLGSALRAYRRLFTDLADERRRPALIHCATGKDRTGWAAAALLLLLGVPDDLVLHDFLASNAHLLSAFESVLRDFEARGGDREILVPLMEVRTEYLAAALDAMHASFGTVERYFAEGLGIGPEGQAALRAAFVEE